MFTEKSDLTKLSRAAAREREKVNIIEIETELLAVIEALASPQPVRKRAELHEERLFHFGELIAIEMHSRSESSRRACAAIIDRLGFDRSELPIVG